MEGRTAHLRVHADNSETFANVKSDLEAMRDRLTAEIENGPRSCPYAQSRKTVIKEGEMNENVGSGRIVTLRDHDRQNIVAGQDVADFTDLIWRVSLLEEETTAKFHLATLELDIHKDGRKLGWTVIGVYLFLLGAAIATAIVTVVK